MRDTAEDIVDVAKNDCRPSKGLCKVLRLPFLYDRVTIGRD